MQYPNVIREKSEHNQLLRLLKKHFMKDEEDMGEMDEENEDGYKTHKEDRGGEMEEEEGYDEPESVTARNDRSIDELEEAESPEHEEEEHEKKLPKGQRKRIAIAVITKRMTKPKR